MSTSASVGEVFSYYQADKSGAQNPDPLLRTGKWIGKYAAKLGLEKGSEIARDDFEAIYYGLDPKTLEPLRPGSMSKDDQIKAATAAAKAKQAFVSAQKKVKKSRARVKLLTQELKEAFTDYGSILEELTARKLQLESEEKELKNAELDHSKAAQKSQRPGTDLVFSAPKSVSMQWAALQSAGKIDEAQAIEQAHDRAVRATFERIEDEFVLTRRRDSDSNRRILEVVQGVAAAQWRHFDARPTDSDGAETAPKSKAVDPHLHDHVNLFGPVEGVDGEIFAAYTEFIKLNLKGLGAMYRAHLAQGLKAAGYQLERDEQKEGLFFSISGITREQARSMSGRSRAIEAAQEAGLVGADAKLLSRQAKNTASGQDLLNAWGQALRSIGVDPDRVLGLGADSEAFIRQECQADAQGLDPSTFDPEAAVKKALSSRLPKVRTDDEILKELLSMEACFSESNVRQKLWEDAQFLPNVSPEELVSVVNARMKTFLAQEDLLMVYDPLDPTTKGHMSGLNRFGEAVFTSKNLRARENVFFGQSVTSLINMKGYAIAEAAAIEIIRKVEASESQRIGGTFKLHDFQLRAALQAACGDSQLCIQIAGAGLGKTTAAKFTKEILVAHGRKVIGVAPSNKAASGLGKELGISTSSVDSLIMRLESGQETIDKNTVIFVDEVGMTSFDLMEQLFKHAERSGAKLILTGDPEQLPSVARGNVLRKLVEMEPVATAPSILFYMGENQSQWHYVSRQKHDWAKRASTYIAKGYVDAGLTEYDRRGFVHSAYDAEELVEQLARGYLEDKTPLKEKLVLASTNRQVDQLNSDIRAALKAAKVLTGAATCEKTKMEFAIGERVIFKEKVGKRQAGLAVAKNEFATVVGVSPRLDGSVDLEIELDTPGLNGAAQRARFNSRSVELGHAYAVTIHRSQGMTVDSVHAAASTFMSKELFYVMATRHRKSLQLHLLERERATILKNSSKNIEKRHANELEAINKRATDETEISDRLAESDAKLRDHIAGDQSAYSNNVLGRLAPEVSSPTQTIQEQIDDSKRQLRAALAALSTQTNLFQMASEQVLQDQQQEIKAAEEQRRRDEMLACLEAADKLWTGVDLIMKKLEPWDSGKQWLAHDDHFIYARDESSSKLEAWPRVLQHPEMTIAAEAGSKRLDLVAACQSEEVKIADRRVADWCFRAKNAWACGPVSITMTEQPAEIRIRIDDGAPGFDRILEKLKNCGGRWSENAWVFEHTKPRAIEALIACGIDLGFAIVRPMTELELADEQAWSVVEQLKEKYPNDPNLKLLQGPEDILSADSSFNAGLFVDSFDPERDASGAETGRKISGHVISTDEHHAYMMLFDAQGSGQTKMLRVPQSTAAPFALGTNVELHFNAEGQLRSSQIIQPKQPVNALPSSPYEFNVIASNDTTTIRKSLAEVCRRRGMTSEAASVLKPQTAIVTMQSELGPANRGSVRPVDLHGTVLGLNNQLVFFKPSSENSIVCIPRSIAGLNELDDQALLSQVGWSRTLTLTRESARFKTPTLGLQEISPPSLDYATVATVLEVDNEFVYLKPSTSRGFYKVRIDDPGLAPIEPGHWQASIGREVLMTVQEGQVTRPPTLRNHAPLNSIKPVVPGQIQGPSMGITR